MVPCVTKMVVQAVQTLACRFFTDGKFVVLHHTTIQKSILLCLTLLLPGISSKDPGTFARWCLSRAAGISPHSSFMFMEIPPDLYFSVRFSKTLLCSANNNIFDCLILTVFVNLFRGAREVCKKDMRRKQNFSRQSLIPRRDNCWSVRSFLAGEVLCDVLPPALLISRP